MHNYLKYPLLLILLVIITITISGCDNNPNQYSFDIYGTITTKSLDKPIENAKVSIAGKTDYTDANGNYSIKNISEGTYNWQVESSKYSDYKQDVYINSDLNISKQLSLITVNATITGTVNIYNSDQNYTIQNMSLNNNIKSDQISLNTNKSEAKYKENQIIVNYINAISRNEIDNFEENNNLNKIKKLNIENNNVVLYQLPSTIEILETVEKFNKNKIIKWSEPNYIMELSSKPNDTDYNKQWGYRKINLEPAWEIIDNNNSTVKVAVIDSGIMPEHDDLRANINMSEAKDYVDGDNNPIDSSNIESHGTHVSGIIAAVSNNSYGVAGISNKIEIIPIRVFENDSADSSKIAEAINYAIDINADIINMSFGGGKNNTSVLQEPIRNAYDAGIVLIASSGNVNISNSELMYPAEFSETIAVGATDINNNIASYSNTGSTLDLVAPGGDGSGIYNTIGYQNNDSLFGNMEGTSMAAPHVSGIAALLLAQGVSPSNIRHRLTSTAVDLGPAGKDNTYGYGLVDAYGALIDKQLRRPYIFAAIKENGSIKIKSEFITLDKNNTYTLNEIVDDEVIVVAWRDVNDNKKVDEGDYYGEYSKEINVLENTLYNNIDIDMYYIPQGDSKNIDVMNMSTTSKL